MLQLNVTCVYFLFKAEHREDSDEESNYSEYLSNLIEIGPPKILKYQSKQNNFGNKSSRVNNDEHPEFLSDFFQKDIKDYLLGGIVCEFCQCKTHPWPSLNKNLPEKVFSFLI